MARIFISVFILLATSSIINAIPLAQIRIDPIKGKTDSYPIAERSDPIGEGKQPDSYPIAERSYPIAEGKTDS
ncbi:14013_t:CDS:1, partial [Gigaspora rosea]